MSDVPARLLEAATRLFAARGYEGTSVRALCAEAGTNQHAVTYHFGGKQGLYQAVIRGVGERRLAAAQRILEQAPRDRSDLETRLLLFADETLVAWLDEPGVLTILLAELQQGFRHSGDDAMQGLDDHMRLLVAFFEAAQKKGLLREGVDVSIVAGGLVERLHNQVLHADAIGRRHGTSVKDPATRRHWAAQVIGLLLDGAATPR